MAIEVTIKIDGVDAEDFIEVFEYVKKRMLEDKDNEAMQDVSGEGDIRRDTDTRG